MPLKHTTETLLLFVLAVAVVLTGLLMQTFADLPNGLVPWSIVFVLAVAYPLLLAPVFRRNRADYEFRLLHWVPAIMLLIWLALQGLMLLWPAVSAILDWYTWGWSLPAVATAFLLLALFVVKVVRRWTVRIGLLALAFLLFFIGSVANEHLDWNRQIASNLWQGEWWKLETGTGGVQVARQESSVTSANLSESVDPAEERHRERLRAIERRRERIAERLAERGLSAPSTSSASSSRSVVAATTSQSSSAPMLGSSSSMPTALPHSGFGWAAILVVLLAGYCASLHRKTVRRLRIHF